ncbi:unnamed protein product [Allacma fusca]|uniref:Ionotropic receptor n=1 Tax=Allacma fusca TaxID=39272 RepID=A0A8J2K456_9HEXA|nr:unnamed protein product [Allacma fusca]
MNLQILLLCLIAYWDLARGQAFIDGKYVNQIALDVKNCILTLVQITKPIDYVEISEPVVLRVFPDKNYKSERYYNTNPFKARSLHCYAAFVFFASPKPFMESTCSESSNSWELRLCKRKQERNLVWATESMTGTKVLSDLVIVFHQDSIPQTQLFEFIQYTHKNVFGNPVFVLHPTNKGPSESIDNINSQERFRNANSPLSTAPDTFAGSFYGGKGNTLKRFHCKASECYGMMMEEFERVTNQGKQIFWQMTWSDIEIWQENLGLKFRSPLERFEPRKLSQTVYEFLANDLDLNFTQTFYGYYTPQIYFDLGNIFIKGYNRVFPVSNIASKIFITSDSVDAITLEYKIYTTPFEALAWICIACGIFCVALILSADIISPGRTPFLEKFMLSLLSVIGSLIDNMIELPMDVSKTSSFKESKSRRIILIAWLISEDLDELIERKLTLPQTALVVFSMEFGYYWNRVRVKMQGTNLKFSHNRNTGNDPFLRTPTSIYISKYFPEKYHYVARRAHVMLSSGLFSMWEKWDRIRFPECNLDFRMQVSHETDVRALSMESSLVLALYAFLWSLLVCLVAFIAEMSIPTRRHVPGQIGPRIIALLHLKSLQEKHH